MSQEIEENIEETETEAAKPELAVTEHKKPKKYPVSVTAGFLNIHPSE